MMKSIVLALTVGGLLSACAPMETATLPPTGEPTQCRAEQYQRYVGRNRSELPATPAGEVRRVLCDTCAMTMDFNPNRVNIIYDTRTEIVEEAKCG